MDSITLGDLITRARDPELPIPSGTGKCCMCGREGDTVKPDFRKTFTSTEFLHATPDICPGCYHLYNTGEYRYCNFIVNDTVFTRLKKTDVIPAVLNISKYPCAIYTTSTYRKQGWIRLVNAITCSDFLVIGWDMNVIRVSKQRIRDLATLSTYLRDQGFPKSLISSRPRVNLILKLPRELQRPMTRFLTLKAGDMVWQWVVEFTVKATLIENETSLEEILWKEL